MYNQLSFRGIVKFQCSFILLSYWLVHVVEDLAELLQDLLPLQHRERHQNLGRSLDTVVAVPSEPSFSTASSSSFFPAAASHPTSSSIGHGLLKVPVPFLTIGDVLGSVDETLSDFTTVENCSAKSLKISLTIIL